MPAPNKQLTAAYQVLATGAANGSAVVLLSFTNTTGGAITIDVNVVPDAGAPLTDNVLIQSLSIPAGDTYSYSEKLLLAVGETVQAKASAITSITTITSYLDL